jgi:ribosome-associated heat shock protein Hsp15
MSAAPHAPEAAKPNPTAARIDKWLFHARFYRTRALAQAAASAGKVRLNGVRVEKPAQTLKPGDILTLGRGSEILAFRVLALADRRGSAPQAQRLYEIVAD